MLDLKNYNKTDVPGKGGPAHQVVDQPYRQVFKNGKTQFPCESMYNLTWLHHALIQNYTMHMHNA